MRQFNNLGNDLIHVDFKVYIEGVEIPFISASINNTYNDKPRATVTIPPYRGLTDLGKGYYPKIHIFYRDFSQPITPYEAFLNGGVENDQGENRYSYKQLFEGVIRNIQDSKSTSGSGYSSLTLDCIHASTVLDEISMNIVSLKPVQSNSATVSGAPSISAVSSLELINKALTGNFIPVTGSGTFGKGTFDPVICSEAWMDNMHRLAGMPGVIASLWNCIKYQSQAAGEVGSGGNTIKDSHPIKNLYAPLLEYGIKFFSKLSGHALVEDMTIASTASPTNSWDPIKGTTEEASAKRGVQVPVTMQHFLKNGISSALSMTMAQAMGNSESTDPNTETNEVATFGSMIRTFLNFIKYDMATLNSPVSMAHINKGDHREHVEYIVKPTLPMYYAPICNVILPNMFDNFSISFQNEGVPSRIALRASVVMDGYGSYSIFNNVNYIAPHSVRLVTWANNANIASTLESYEVKVGYMEWGYGIRFMAAEAPYWYNMLMNDNAIGELEGSVTEAMEEANVTKAADAWDNVFGGTSKSFNPWRASEVTGLKPYQVVNFVASDGEFGRMIANTRVGSVSSVFNPFIIPGYPMDVIDPSPERESYHGFCTSVSHSIDSQGHASTSIGMSSVLTYSELVSCYIPLTEPWQVTTLGFENGFSLYNNRSAYEKACQFYAYTLGVGAADPTLLENYSLGVPVPVTRERGVWKAGTASDTGNSLYESVLGNLILTARNIKSLPEVEAEYCPTDETFIDIEMWNEGSPTASMQPKYGWMEDTKVISTMKKDRYLEASPYLDYDNHGESEEYYLPSIPVDPTAAADYVPTSANIEANNPLADRANTLIPDTNQGTGAVCQLGGIFDANSWAYLRTCDLRLQKVFIEVHKRSPCIITSGHRTIAQQADAYRRQGAIGTAARPGNSKHNRSPSMAVDAVPCGHRFGNGMSPTRTAFANLVRQVGSEMGITVKWGGNFRTVDPVHFYIE